MGRVHVHEAGAVSVPEYRIPAGRVESERERLADAAERGSRQIATLRTKARGLPGAAGEELDYLLDAHQQMLKDSRLIKGVIERIGTERLNAEAAVRREMDSLADAFASMQDPYLAARADDIRDIGWRLIRLLTGTTGRPLSPLPRNTVLIAHDLSPADTALLTPRDVAGLVLASGGSDSHTAIMARSLGLPAVLAVPDVLRHARSGDLVCVDGGDGLVVIDPDAQTLAEFRARRAEFLRTRRNLGRLRDLPAETLDGARVTVMANVELAGELDTVHQCGAEGIGLLRTEFMFMNRPTLPSEDEQYAFLRAIVEGMRGRPVTIRTLDVGGDKLSEALELGESPNPALGLRAIRLSLSRPALLEAQLAAILRAGLHGPVRLLLPMIGSIEELRQVHVIRDRVVKRLRAASVPLPDPLPPLGVMIEIPGAALSADTLARHCDFFAIGTNDLIQYTLAIDRSDPAVAPLYNPLHPAVLRLIQFTVGAAARAGIPISVCGEMAGDPRLAGVLLGLGVTSLSMSANNIPRVKQNIRRLSLADAEARTAALMALDDAQAIAALADHLLVNRERTAEK
ncbi:phosphoenolpyruvate-protein phosphotransferase [Pararhodospirillum oryzae]|uniref:Phosphoenolpyruvate-protein phosphotransferase n=2 Tax=Pararhodospirillum oryzae TaxID=478448 RepID=A0A512HAE1_9PROT|nr:phosphoenolpyruvate-protein phosphotransferase [Pararhodospirillum oryzae]